MMLYQTRKSKIDNPLLPHNLEAEEAVIGALLIDPDGFIQIGLMGLKKSDFFIGHLGWIFEAIENLSKRRVIVDLVTICDELERLERLHSIGGPAELTRLLNVTPSSVHLSHYAEIVKLHSVKRQVIAAGTKIVQDAYQTEETDLHLVLSQAGEELLKVQQGNQKAGGASSKQVVNEFLDRLELLQSTENGIIGIPTGLTELDFFSQGLQNGQFIILAAPPGAGKTSLAIQLACNAAGSHNKNVLVISAEMTKLSLMTRIISAQAQVDSAKMKSGTMNRSEYGRVLDASGQVAGWPLIIDDKTTNIDAITAGAIMQHTTVGLDLIVIDYIQRLTVGHSNRLQDYEKISRISNALKDLANTLNIPVLAISSILEKQIAGRNSKRPERADLRGSGDLAYDADQIWFLYSEDVVTEIIIDKNREGRVGTARVFFKKELTKFLPLDQGAKYVQI